MNDKLKRERDVGSGLESPPDLMDSGDMTMAELLSRQAPDSGQLARGNVTEGEVVFIDDDGVLVDIGLKSEGFVPARELGDPAEDLGRPLEVGDRILVALIHPAEEGQAVLSYRRARRERRWRQLEVAIKTGEILEAPIVDHNRGGVVVDLDLMGFVPISQLSTSRRSEGDGRDEVLGRLADRVGTKIFVRVLEVDRKRNRLILSERLAERSRREQEREKLFDRLEPGQILDGTVRNLASFGAFIDLGGADGLAHISELSWDHVNQPSDVLEAGQRIKVYVLSLDREDHKIALSVKRVQEDPWDSIEKQLPPGENVQGSILRHSDYGVFIKVYEGVEGYLHPSDVDSADVPFLVEGRVLPFRVLHIDFERRRLRLLPAFEHLDDQGQVVPESQDGTYAPAGELDDEVGLSPGGPDDLGGETPGSKTTE